ncbi:hypothetical protein NPIL_22091 [Nephila pilipes]|uniref:Uncharacterized protein n=1 Tax=Nephila pilipes TaxID=299642 RepID=A0A8X6NJ42_NEPPI|nr:hypothetical protein NPIL_22091 [Nephila pilipes]
MKSFWKICLVLLSILAAVIGHHHHQGSNLAHILAAGLIVQMLSHHGHHKHHHHGHHHHESRHNPLYSHHHQQQYQYRTPEWGGQESRAQQEMFAGQGNHWAYGHQMNAGFPQAQFTGPAMGAYNAPAYYGHQVGMRPF